MKTRSTAGARRVTANRVTANRAIGNRAEKISEAHRVDLDLARGDLVAKARADALRLGLRVETFGPAPVVDEMKLAGRHTTQQIRRMVATPDAELAADRARRKQRRERAPIAKLLDLEAMQPVVHRGERPARESSCATLSRRRRQA